MSGCYDSTEGLQRERTLRGYKGHAEGAGEQGSVCLQGGGQHTRSGHLGVAALTSSAAIGLSGSVGSVLGSGLAEYKDSITPLSLYLPLPRSAVIQFLHHSPTYRNELSSRSGDRQTDRPTSSDQSIINCWHPSAEERARCRPACRGGWQLLTNELHSFHRLASRFPTVLGSGACVPFSPHFFPPLHGSILTHPRHILVRRILCTAHPSTRAPSNWNRELVNRYFSRPQPNGR